MPLAPNVSPTKLLTSICGQERQNSEGKLRKTTKGGENRFGGEEGGQKKKKKTDLSEQRRGLHVWGGDKALISDMLTEK